MASDDADHQQPSRLMASGVFILRFAVHETACRLCKRDLMVGSLILSPAVPDVLLKSRTSKDCDSVEIYAC